MRAYRTWCSLLASVLLLSACGKAPEPSEEAASDSGLAAPDVTGSSAARGVAFTFDFTFALPPRTIAKVQRAHVAACEQLGATRCRIVGVTFDQQHGNDASGSLSMLLAPGDAYRFAGHAVDLVEAAKGEIDAAMVEGRDAAGAIAQAQQAHSDTTAEIDRIEARLSASGLTESERSQLTARLEELHRQDGEQVASRRENERTLASTPVTFRYVGTGALSGDNRFLRAASQSWSSVQDALIIGVILLGYLLPWGLLVGGTVLVVRWLRRRRKPASE